LRKKNLAILTIILAISITITPFALAKPWEYPKNNDKFQSFSVTLNGVLPSYENEFKPNEENKNVIVQRWGNNIIEYEIVIDDNWHYLLGDDFEYDQQCVHTAIGFPFINMGGMGYYLGAKSNHLRIEYTFDFTDGDGIEGKLEMLMVDNNGIISIRSLSGTGDLRNVQIMATSSGLGSHGGIVLGWPNIEGATD
jgi:hypothetical protein